MLQIEIVGNQVFEVEKKNGEVLVNGKTLDWDVSQIDERHFHIISEGRSFNLEIVESDAKAKAYTLKINGKMVEAIAKNKLDLLLDSLGMAQGNAQKAMHLEAPMPGRILEICVEEGISVNTGEKLVVLEAMKMENVLKSPVDGKVKSIEVKAGDNVEKKQLLIHFE